MFTNFSYIIFELLKISRAMLVIWDLQILSYNFSFLRCADLELLEAFQEELVKIEKICFSKDEAEIQSELVSTVFH